MGRKKTEEPKQPGPTPFEERLNAFLGAVARGVAQTRSRPGGAAKFGRDAMYVLAVEAIDTAPQAGVNGFVAGAIYSVVAAMMTAGAWDEPAPAKEGEPEGPTPEGQEPPMSKSRQRRLAAQQRPVPEEVS